MDGLSRNFRNYRSTLHDIPEERRKPEIKYVPIRKGKGKGKAIPLQTYTGPEGSRRLRFPVFKTVGT